MKFIIVQTENFKLNQTDNYNNLNQINYYMCKLKFSDYSKLTIIKTEVPNYYTLNT